MSRRMGNVKLPPFQKTVFDTQRSALAGSLVGISCNNSDNVLIPVQLAQPEVRRSLGGFLDTVLNISVTPNRLGGLSSGKGIKTGVYEGMPPGPTLRVRPGDVMNIRLTNNLPPNPDVTHVNPLLPHQIYSTNLHTHGLHASPSGNSDTCLINISISIPQLNTPSFCIIFGFPCL